MRIINSNLSAVMDKNAYTVHGLNKNANAPQITIGFAHCVTYDYQALARVNATFTINSTRAAGALMSFKGVKPLSMSWSGLVIDVSGASKSRCSLTVNGSDDGDGNVWLTTNTSLPAGTYYIDSLNAMY